MFSRKYASVIHIITGISILGIAIGTAALILILSVFNGFEDLLKSLYSNFNPDIKVTVVEGRFFEEDSVRLESILALDGVDKVAITLEDFALFENEENRSVGIKRPLRNCMEMIHTGFSIYIWILF